MQSQLEVWETPEFDEVVIVLGHEAARIEAALDLPSTGRVALNERFAEGHHGSVRVGFAVRE